MTKSQLTCFIEVAHCGSFSKAADRLYISQPAVSRQIAQLEKELGLTLFNRTNKSVELTPSGKLLYNHFIKTQEEFEKILSKAHQLNNDNPQVIRLGCFDGWDISGFYPQMRKFFAKNFPNLQLELTGYNIWDLPNALLRGKIDIAIGLDCALKSVDGISMRKFTSLETILLFSAQHPLAKKKGPSLAGFKDVTFLVVAPLHCNEISLADLTKDICTAEGFIPKIEYTNNFQSALMKLQVSNSALVASSWINSKDNPLYKYMPLNCYTHACLSWVDDKNPSAKNVIINSLLSHYGFDSLY